MVQLQVRRGLTGAVVHVEVDSHVTIGELQWQLDRQRQKGQTLREKRVAPDGHAYTREAFISHFGGLVEWESAPEGGDPDHRESRICCGSLKIADGITVAEAGLTTDTEVQLVLVPNLDSALSAVLRCWDNLVRYPGHRETESRCVRGVVNEVGLQLALELLVGQTEALWDEDMRLLFITGEVIMRRANEPKTVEPHEQAEATPWLEKLFRTFAELSMTLYPNEVERFIASSELLQTAGAELGFVVLARTVATKCMGVDLRRLTGAVHDVLRRWGVRGELGRALGAAEVASGLAALLCQAQRGQLVEEVGGMIETLREHASTVHMDVVVKMHESLQA